MKRASLVGLFFILLVVTQQLVPSQSSDVSSAKLYVNQRLLQEGVTLATPFIFSAIQKATIPDQTISAIGIYLYLRNITISNLNVAQPGGPAIVMVPSDTIQLNINNIGCLVSMEWEYHNGLLDFKGSADDTMTGTNFQANIQLSSDGHGNPKAQISSTSFNIGSLDIQLHGDGGSFFQAIASLITPIIKKVLQDQVAGIITSKVNQIITNALSKFHPYYTISNHTSIYFGLVSSSSQHGLAGSEFSNNHFGGSQSNLLLNDELQDTVHVNAYHSVDVNGYVTVPTTGSYALSIHHSQRVLLEFNGHSAGKLEMWNIGMCWPQTNDETTGLMTLEAGKFYPVRIRFQSGCAGGWFQVRLCPNGASCSVINPVQLFTQPTAEVPIAVYPNYFLLATEAEVQYDQQEIDLPRHIMPNDPGSNNMVSVGVDEYVVNSLLWAMTTEGNLTYTLTNQNIPGGIPFKLNTEAFKFIFPDVYNKYPGYDMTATISVTKGQYPTLDIDEFEGLHLNAPISIILNILDKNNQNLPLELLQLDIATTLAIKPTIDDTKNLITGTLEIANLKFSLAYFNTDVFTNSTEVTDLINNFIQPTVSNLIQQVLMPMANAMLQQGFPLPKIMNILALANANIQYSQGFLIFSTDLQISFMGSFVEWAATNPIYPSQIEEVLSLPQPQISNDDIDVVQLMKKSFQSSLSDVVDEANKVYLF